MTYTLENEQSRVTIQSSGAELSSFIRKDLDNLEYIWEADPAVWARHAPVLFPIGLYFRLIINYLRKAIH